MNKILKCTSWLFGLMAAVTVASAATDGTLGSTSTGDFDIALDVQDLILVSGLSDVVLPTFIGAGDSSETMDFCVYRNSSVNTAFTLTLDDGDADTRYILDGPNASVLPYTVTVNGVNVVKRAPTNDPAFVADNTSFTCGGAPNTTLEVMVQNADLEAAEAGNYTGTLTITVAPI